MASVWMRREVRRNWAETGHRVKILDEMVAVGVLGGDNEEESSSTSNERNCEDCEEVGLEGVMVMGSGEVRTYV